MSQDTQIGGNTLTALQIPEAAPSFKPGRVVSFWPIVRKPWTVGEHKPIEGALIAAKTGFVPIGSVLDERG